MTSPPSLPTLDTEALRRRLAGLVDPNRQPGVAEGAEIPETTARLCSILANLFGEELDRMTLWARIGSAFATAHAKVANDADLDRFVSLCLEHVAADSGRTAACEPLLQLIETFAARPPEWRHAFLSYIETRRYAVLVRGRARWERVKRGECEL
jgi:hypothetical protein